MTSRYFAGALGILLVATTAPLAVADSTATITQGGGGSFVRKVFRSPDSQTIVQKDGGNSVVITQRSSRGKAHRNSVVMSDDMSMDTLVSVSPELQQELEELAMDEGTTVQALVEAAIQDYLDRNY